MKHFYVFLFLSFHFLNHSQNFTNGSVYNYNVGDSIVTSFTNYPDGWFGAGIISYQYRVFTSKHIATSQDTIYYTTHDVNYTSKQCFSCTTVINATNTSFYITDLSASLLNFTLSTSFCPSQVDTTFKDECNRYVHTRELNYTLSDSCFFYEANTLSYTFIEGIGSFTETRTGNSDPQGKGWKTAFVSAHKAGSLCGVVGTIPDGIKEWGTQNNLLRIHPNPSSGIYFIDAIIEGNLIVQNTLGNILDTKPLLQGKTSLDLSDKPDGIYILKCINNSNIITLKIVKQ